MTVVSTVSAMSATVGGSPNKKLIDLFAVPRADRPVALQLDLDEIEYVGASVGLGELAEVLQSASEERDVVVLLGQSVDPLSTQLLGEHLVGGHDWNPQLQIGENGEWVTESHRLPDGGALKPTPGDAEGECRPAWIQRTEARLVVDRLSGDEILAVLPRCLSGAAVRRANPRRGCNLLSPSHAVISPPSRTSGSTACLCEAWAMRDVDLSGRSEPFTPGDTVVVVEVMNGKVWTVRPVTVIKDSPDEIALWLAPGTTTLYPSGPQHGEHTVRQWIAGEWELINRRWGPPGKLRLTRPGDAFEVWASPGMHDDGTPWYVNLQDPLRRVGAGFTTMDHLLDILVSPDLHSWEWKDEAEFAFAEQTGLFSAPRAAEIRAMGLEIIKAVEVGQPPWEPSWATWNPEP